MCICADLFEKHVCTTCCIGRGKAGAWNDQARPRVKRRCCRSQRPARETVSTNRSFHCELSVLVAKCFGTHALQYESVIRVEIAVDTILAVRDSSPSVSNKLDEDLYQRLPTADEQKLEKELARWVSSCCSVSRSSGDTVCTKDRDYTGHQVRLA